jgi:hypothetical protein
MGTRGKRYGWYVFPANIMMPEWESEERKAESDERDVSDEDMPPFELAPLTQEEKDAEDVLILLVNRTPLTYNPYYGLLTGGTHYREPVRTHRVADALAARKLLMAQERRLLVGDDPPVYSWGRGPRSSPRIPITQADKDYHDLFIIERNQDRMIRGLRGWSSEVPPQELTYAERDAAIAIAAAKEARETAFLLARQMDCAQLTQLAGLSIAPIAIVPAVPGHGIGNSAWAQDLQ